MNAFGLEICFVWPVISASKVDYLAMKSTKSHALSGFIPVVFDFTHFSRL
jgi:hypothetical protein